MDTAPLGLWGLLCFLGRVSLDDAMICVVFSVGLTVTSAFLHILHRLLFHHMVHVTIMISFFTFHFYLVCDIVLGEITAAPKDFLSLAVTMKERKILIIF